MIDTLTVGVDWQHFDDQDVVTVQVGATVPPACPRPRGMPDKGRRTRSVSMNANVRRVLWSLCEDRDGEDLVFSLRVSGRGDAEARSAEKPCFAGASHEGDDRNRTGVDGFAVRPRTLFSAYLSGFRGCQALSGALKTLVLGEFWESRRLRRHRRGWGPWFAESNDRGGWQGVLRPEEARSSDRSAGRQIPPAESQPASPGRRVESASRGPSIAVKWRPDPEPSSGGAARRWPGEAIRQRLIN